MPTRPPGGSDVIPETVSGVVVSYYFWDADRRDEVLPEKRFRTVSTPSYGRLLINGPWIGFLSDIQRYGSVILTITQSNLQSGTPNGFQGAPPYADVWYNSVDYKMLIGAKVTPVPAIVPDILNNSGGSFAAVVASPTFLNGRGNTFADMVGVRFSDIHR